MGNTSIEWTDFTWNPVTGCSKVSPGCDNCYAETIQLRFKRSGPFDRTGDAVQLHPERLAELERLTNRVVCTPGGWQVTPGDVRRVFVCSMSDLFHTAVPDEFIDQVFLQMAVRFDLTFQVLTKRPNRVARWWEGFQARRALDPTRYPAFMLGRGWWKQWPRHIWIGTSVESHLFMRRVEMLARVPAPVRFVSCEPLIGGIELDEYFEPKWGCRNTSPDHFGLLGAECAGCEPAINWVIVGGESGRGARLMHLEWVEDIVRACRRAQVPVFVKQLGTFQARMNGRRWKDFKGGDPAEWPEHLRVRQWPDTFDAAGSGEILKQVQDETVGAAQDPQAVSA